MSVSDWRFVGFLKVIFPSAGTSSEVKNKSCLIRSYEKTGPQGPTRSDTNWAIQPKMMARIFKFRI